MNEEKTERKIPEELWKDGTLDLSNLFIVFHNKK